MGQGSKVKTVLPVAPAIDPEEDIVVIDNILLSFFFKESGCGKIQTDACRSV